MPCGPPQYKSHSQISQPLGIIPVIYPMHQPSPVRPQTLTYLIDSQLPDLARMHIGAPTQPGESLEPNLPTLPTTQRPSLWTPCKLAHPCHPHTTRQNMYLNPIGSNSLSHSHVFWLTTELESTPFLHSKVNKVSEGLTYKLLM